MDCLYILWFKKIKSSCRATCVCRNDQLLLSSAWHRGDSFVSCLITVILDLPRFSAQFIGHIDSTWQIYVFRSPPSLRFLTAPRKLTEDDTHKFKTKYWVWKNLMERDVKKKRIKAGAAHTNINLSRGIDRGDELCRNSKGKP